MNYDYDYDYDDDDDDDDYLYGDCDNETAVDENCLIRKMVTNVYKTVS